MSLKQIKKRTLYAVSLALALVLSYLERDTIQDVVTHTIQPERASADIVADGSYSPDSSPASDGSPAADGDPAGDDPGGSGGDDV